jgi:outer membrane protein assembly factor BamB
MQRSDRNHHASTPGGRTLRLALLTLALAACGSSEDAGREPLEVPDAGTLEPLVSGCVTLPESWADGGAQWGTQQDDELLDARVDRAGRLYLAGYERGTQDATVTPGGDSLGALWTLEPGALAPSSQVLDLPGTSEVIDALTVHPDTGKPYFAGRTTGAFAGYTSRGRQDVIVGDVGPAGAPRVLFQGGDAHPQHPTRLAFDAAGELIVAGYDDYTVEGSAVTRWEDPFVLELHATDGALQPVWWQHDDTEQQDLLLGLGAGSSGVFVAGGVTSSGATAGPFVRKLDAQGQTVWSRRLSDLSLDMIAAVHVLPDGRVLVAGSTFRTLGARTFGGQDAFVQLLDPETGAHLWTAQVGSAGADYLTGLAVDPVDGSITLVGETLGAFDAAHPNAGDFDVFLARLDANGELQATQQWGSAGDERPTAVALDACGRAFVVGYTTGALMGPSRGGRDAFVLTTARTRHQRP